MFGSLQKGSVLVLSPVDVVGPNRANFNSPKVDRAPRKLYPEAKSNPVRRFIPKAQVQVPPAPALKSKRSPASPYAQPHSPIASIRKPATPGSNLKIPRDDQKESFSYDQKTPVASKHSSFSSSPKTPPPSQPVTPPQEAASSGSVETPVKNKTIFSPSYSEPEPAEELPLEDEFDPWLFIKNLPPLSAVQRENRARRFLPKRLKQAPETCLALDLDETLVHCSVQPIRQPDLTFTVAFNGVDYEVYVRMRPYLKEFLNLVSQWFEIVVFTASQKVYADKLLSMLDPSNKYIAHRMFRDSCLCVDGNYLKDLSVLGRDIRKVAIIDNSVQAFGYHLNNGIPIESWFDDDEDQELMKLIPFLKRLKDCADVRAVIKETFRLEDYLRSRFGA